MELKYDLERNVKLVKFENGKIDINFNENLNFKMSNMNMNIKIEHKNKIGSLPTSHWVDPKKLKNYTLPTFTKRIVRYLESNK